MLNKTKLSYYKFGAALTTGMLIGSAGTAHAANNFGSISNNIVTSIATLPGLLSALAYMFGILLGVLGIMKIKDHVENPSKVDLKDGAIRLAAGGALFALPIVFEAMIETTGSNGAATSAAKLKAIQFQTI